MSLNNRQIDSLERIVNYMYDEEEKHFEEENKPQTHIFRDVVILKRLLHKRYEQKY
tara:strand:+ start:311 stop:478 length:168 start_codon:yes stop_codon:yes gene_type:complete